MLVNPVHNHLLVSLHQLKQAAVNELKTLEQAAERILFLRKHADELDAELVAVAKRIEASGAHTDQWENVPTMPQGAKELLAANKPAEDVAPLAAEALPEGAQ